MSFLIISELRSEDSWHVDSLLIRKGEVEEACISQEVLNVVGNQMLESMSALVTTNIMKKGTLSPRELKAQQTALTKNVHIIGNLINETSVVWADDVLSTDYKKVFELTERNGNVTTILKMRLIVIANPHSTNPLDYPAHFNQTFSAKH